MSTTRNRASHHRGWRARLRAHLFVRALENRLAPAQFVVTSSADSGSGSLRAIIGSANSNGEADTITFDPSAFAVPQTIALTTGEIAISDALRINGPTAALMISGNNLSRIFNYTPAGSNKVIAVSGISFVNGRATTGDGGAILIGQQSTSFENCQFISNTAAAGNGGALGMSPSASAFTATDCEFSSNSAFGAGGAIYDSGSNHTLLRCNIANNKAASAGGVSSGYSLIVDSCSLVGNVANGTASKGKGGGILAAGSITIRNSTISGNSAAVSGGGVSISSTTTVLNSTITANSAAANGGGIGRVSGTGTVTLTSSIVAANISGLGPDLAFNAASTLTASNNLIGVTNSGNFTLSGTNNLVGTLALPLNPLLAPLANNGGVTLTHALLAGSPAIDAGINSANLLLEQRGPGFLRRIDSAGSPNVSDGTDIGAYETGQVSNPPAGKLDSTFGIGGQVIQRFPYPDSEGSATVMDDFGRLLVAGSTNDGTRKVFAVARFLTNGSLDASFNGNGKVTIAFGNTDDYASGIAVDPSGRIVVAGSTYNGANHDFALARLNADGNLDTSFNSTGRITFAFGARDDTARALSVDSTGRITVFGTAGDTANPSNFAIARLTSTGVLDHTFDGDGKKIINLGPQSYGYGLSIDFNSRLVLGGYQQSNSSSDDFTVVRLLSDGNFDLTFDGDGVVAFDFNSSLDRAYAVIVDQGGRPIIAGVAAGALGLARLTVEGQFDTSFDFDGKKTISTGVSVDTARGLIVDSVGRIVVAGYNANQTHVRDFVVVRVDDAGAFDPSLNGTGLLTFPAGTSGAGANVGGAAVITDSANRLIIVGTMNEELPGPALTIARIQQTGELDASFGIGGRSVADFLTNSCAWATDVAMDHMGRTVVAGMAAPGNSGLLKDFVVSRYLPNGALDVSFGGTGTLSFNFFETFDYKSEACTAIAIDGMNRVLIGGDVANPSNSDFVVVRLTANGVFDPTFANNGKLTLDINGGDDSLSGIALDSAGRIVIAGYTFNGALDGAVAVRLTPAGDLDTSFCGTGKVVLGFPALARATSVAVDALDRVIIAGYSGSSASNVGVSRLTANGLPDVTFAGTSAMSFQFGNKSSFAYAVTVDGFGGIVVAGASSVAGAGCGVARINPNGTLDTTFDGDGKMVFSIGGSLERLQGVAIDSTGRIVVGGTSTIGSGSTGLSLFTVARLTPTGFLDPSFRSIGQNSLGFGDSLAFATAMTLDSSDRPIIVGGTGVYRSVNPENVRFAIARLTGDSAGGLPAKAASVTVNNGTVQRSRVTFLKITFDQPVALPTNPATSFTLKRQGDNALPLLSASVDNTGTGTVVTLTFTGTTAVDHASLADGRYTLSILANMVNGGYFDGNADGIAGDDHVLIGTPANGLFRLFGDSDGDGAVATNDFIQIRLSFASSNIVFDFNGDGYVSANDFLQFRMRFGGDV